MQENILYNFVKVWSFYPKSRNFRNDNISQNYK